MPKRLLFHKAMEHIERWGEDAPTALMKDAEVEMFHPADGAYPDGGWEVSLVRLHRITAALAKGWTGELPEGRTLRGDAAETQLVNELAELLAQNDDDKPLQCPYCDHAPYKTERGLTDHVAAKH